MTRVPLTSNGHHLKVRTPPGAALLLLAGLGLTGAAMLLTPGITAPPPSAALVAGGGLVLLVAALGVRLPSNRAAGWTLAAWLGWLAWAALSTMGSLERHQSEVTLISWVGALGVLTSLALGTPDSKAWRAAAWLMIALSLGLSGWALSEEGTAMLEALGQGGELPRLRATFTNSDCFAAVLMGSLLLQAGLMAGAGPSERLLLLMSASGLLATLLATGSRSALLGAGAGYLLFGWLMLRRRDPEGRRSALLGWIAPVTLLAFLLASSLLTPLLGRWSLLFEEQGRQGVEMRWAVARDGLLCLADRPLLGSGPGTFHLAFQERRPPGLRAYVNAAHNDFMQVAVEVGLPGLLLYLLAWALPASRAVQAARSGPLPAEAAAAAAAVFGTATYTLLNFAIPVPANLWWWAGLAGLCLSSSLSKERPRPFSGIATLMVALLLAVVGASGLWMSLRVHRTARALDEAAALGASLRWEQAQDRLQEVLQADPLDPRPRHRLAELKERQATYLDKPDLLAESLDLLQEASRLSPSDLPTRLERARLLARTGRFQEADALLQETEALAPNDLRVQARMAEVHLRRGHLPGAIQALWEAGALTPNTIRPISRLLAALEVSAPGQGARALPSLFKDPSRRQEALILGEEATDHLLRERQPQAATRLLTALVEQDPSNLCLLKKRADLAREEGRPAEALQTYARILDDSTAEGERNATCRGEALSAWTALSLEQGQASAAARRLQSDLASKPWEARIRICLADAQAAQGDQEGEGQTLREGLSRSPGDPALLTRMGRHLEQRGAQDLALQSYLDALRRDPENPAAREGARRLEKARRQP